jgi:hypothetical protein
MLMNEVNQQNFEEVLEVNTTMNHFAENETSPETLDGSFSRELMLGKLDLLQQLRYVLDELDVPMLNVAYILGSWYGNLGILMALDNFPVKKIINVDIEPNYIKLSKEFMQRLDARAQHMIQDVNKLDYRQARKPSVIINASCNDIAGSSWFDRIPLGTLVVLNAGDQEDSLRTYQDLNALVQTWPMRKLLLADEFVYGDYQRFTVIGIK